MKVFYNRLKNITVEANIHEIEALFRKVTQNLMFNLHEIEDDSDVFVAFKTVNNIGLSSVFVIHLISQKKPLQS